MTALLSQDCSSSFVQGSRPDVRIEKLTTSAYRVPTEALESDGTFDWESTTLVLVEASAGGCSGLGYSYASPSTGRLIADSLSEVVIGSDAMAVPATWAKMVQAIRNLGRPGVCSMAIAAVDTALWDLKARLLGLPLVELLGRARPNVPIYGSGGFTSYSLPQLQAQLSGWVQQGISRVKMKVGRCPQDDLARVRAVRETIGPEPELFVDANGAYDRKQALAQAADFAEARVSWFEEPVSSDDLDGLRLLRDRSPDGMEIAAGEYGYDQPYFRRMLEAGAVDVLQADATRCAGITGFLQAATLADAFGISLSAHTAPALHLHACCAVPRCRHLEYFHDHARIEEMFFDGVAKPVNGALQPPLNAPGLSLEFKRANAARFAVPI